MRAGRTPHRVVALVDSDSNSFEHGYALRIFTANALRVPSPAYEFRLCSADPAQATAGGGIRSSLVQDISAADQADTLLAPNRADIDQRPSPLVVEALRRAHARGARLVACWSGAFTLAEAGLLDRRRATTHWRWADTFRARFPTVLLEPNVLFVDDGDVLTGAGGASAVDLSLYIIGQDLGLNMADLVSDELLLGRARSWNSPQRLARTIPESDGDSLAPLMDWARARLDAALTVSELAAFAAVSEATLYRRFRGQAGMTPLAWLTNERLALARVLLERGSPALILSLEEPGSAPRPTCVS